MAPPRAYWSGHIRLSLVSFPVRLYPATTSGKEIQFHQIDKKSGERIRYQTVVPDKGPVPREEIVKGYEYERGRFITFEPEELDDLKVETKHTIELNQFVDTRDVDIVYFEKPYFVVPDGEIAAEAYVVVRDALRDTKKTGIGQIVLSGKERIAALRPCGKGLLLETLRYADEVRKANLYFDTIADKKGDEDQIALAKTLIERKTAEFDPSKFEDHYQNAVKELIAIKLGQQKPEPDEAPRRTATVVNLMDALKKSVANEGGKAPAEPAKGKAKPAPKSRAKAEPEEERAPARRKKTA